MVSPGFANLFPKVSFLNGEGSTFELPSSSRRVSTQKDVVFSMEFMYRKYTKRITRRLYSSTDYDHIALFKRNLTTFFHPKPRSSDKFWDSEPEIPRESLDGPRRHFPDQRCDTYALTWNIPQGQWWYIYIYCSIENICKKYQTVVCF